MDGRREGRQKEGRRIPSQFILIPAVSLLRAPVVRHYRERWRATTVGGTEGHNSEKAGGKEGGESVEREWADPYSLPRGSVVLISVRISNLNILSS